MINLKTLHLDSKLKEIKKAEDIGIIIDGAAHEDRFLRRRRYTGRIGGYLRHQTVAQDQRAGAAVCHFGYRPVQIAFDNGDGIGIAGCDNANGILVRESRTKQMMLG